MPKSFVANLGSFFTKSHTNEHPDQIKVNELAYHDRDVEGREEMNSAQIYFEFYSALPNSQANILIHETVYDGRLNAAPKSYEPMPVQPIVMHEAETAVQERKVNLQPAAQERKVTLQSAVQERKVYLQPSFQERKVHRPFVSDGNKTISAVNLQANNHARRSLQLYAQHVPHKQNVHKNATMTANKTTLKAENKSKALVKNKIKTNNNSNHKVTLATVIKAEDLEKELSEQLKQTNFIIHIASFYNRTEAERYHQRLNRAGFNVSLLQAKKGKQAIYHIQQGPFSSIHNANWAQKKLKKEGIASLIYKGNAR